MGLLYKLKYKLKRKAKVYAVLAPIFGLYRGTRMCLARARHGIAGNTVVFSAFSHRSYNDNPRYISEALHELRPQTDIVWLFTHVKEAKEKYDIPSYVRILQPISSEGVDTLARARVIVDNYSKRFYLRFDRKNQIYIQTWHGDRAFKKVGYDNKRNLVPMQEEHCSLGITGSDYGDRQFRSAFNYKGELMKVGYPRNDILVRNDPEEAAAFRKKIGVTPETGILLYAPTFRDTATRAKEKEKAHLDLAHVLDTLEETTGRKWICFVRTHYQSFGIDIKTDDRLISMTDYPEMAELLLISDALITDYSSCAGDFALTRRPIWLYQDDIDDYVNNSRKLYFDMKDSPYLVASTPEEMDELIRSTTPESAKENCDAILKFYGEAETGHAAQSIAEYIVAKLDENCSRKK